MSDTPRTDSIEPRVLQRYQQAEDILAEDNAKIAIGEMAYFARELERQNAALQARLDAAHAREDELAEFLLTRTISSTVELSKQKHALLTRHAAAKEQRNKP